MGVKGRVKVRDAAIVVVAFDVEAQGVPGLLYLGIDLRSRSITNE